MCGAREEIVIMNRPTETSDEPRIEAYRVPDDARLGTLPRHFGARMVVVENAIYGFMRNLAPEYQGGYWHLYELSNGGFYMAPEMPSVRLCVAGNGFEGEMTADAAGITACLFALSQLSFQYPDDARISSHFHKLRDFALDHEEERRIFQAID
jgi:hypothetical protein